MKHAGNSGWVRHHDGDWVKPNNAAELAAMFWQVGEVSVHDALKAPMGDKTTGASVVVNDGRWLVRCPDCGSAQLAFPDDRRFMCSECANAAIKGKWRPVIWPKDAEEIGELIDARHELKHWEPDETVEDLRRQNVLLAGGVLEIVADKASEFEGHTHKWGKPNTFGIQTCGGCKDTVHMHTLVTSAGAR